MTNAVVDRPLRRRAACAGLVFLLAGAASALGQARGPGPGDDKGSKLDFDPKAPPGSFAIIDNKAAPIPDVKLGDARVVAKIIDEGKNRNQVMQRLEHITKKIGNRLTGSTRLKAANDWCKELYEQWGLSNVELYQWGTVGMGFDRGPSTGAIYKAGEARDPGPRVRQRTGGGPDNAAALAASGAAPAAKPADAPPEQKKVEWTKVRDMELTTLAWTRGTDGPVRGPIIRAPYGEAEYLGVKDRLKGAWIMVKPPGERGMREVRGRVSTYYEQFRSAREQVAAGEKSKDQIDLPARLIFDGVAGFVMCSRDERVWTGAVKGWRELTADKIDPEPFVMVRLSDYDYINSRLTDGEQIEVEFDLKNEFVPGPVPVYDTLAEIRGTTKPDECVIISAHLDSWNGPGSEGCTDNGTGTSVTLEAARILATVLKNAPPEAQPKRSIRFINWSGEEQGLLGSDAWVQAHPELHAKISACFVDDGGTNYEGGLGAFPEQVPILAAATAPINNVFYSQKDGAFLNVNIRTFTGTPASFGGGGSDHMSFNKVGVPGFFWDEIGRADYGFGWHTQNDKLDLAIPEYLEQSATNAALTAYQLACADTLLPRPPKAEEKKEEKKEDAPRTQAPTGGAAPGTGTGR